MTHEEAVSRLIENYQNIFQKKSGTPDWTCKKMNGIDLVHCPIPFVGKHYFE